MYYIGLDVHKKAISYCVKDGSGRIYAEGSVPATRLTLDMWMKTLPQPWTAAMEATIFTAWIYDHLKPHVAAVKVAHPLMLRAIAVAKKNSSPKNSQKIQLDGRSPQASVQWLCKESADFRAGKNRERFCFQS